MRVLVVFAHPVEPSFQAALHRTVVESLTRAGHGRNAAERFSPDNMATISSRDALSCAAMKAKVPRERAKNSNAATA